MMKRWIAFAAAATFLSCSPSTPGSSEHKEAPKGEAPSAAQAPAAAAPAPAGAAANIDKAKVGDLIKDRRVFTHLFLQRRVLFRDCAEKSRSIAQKLGGELSVGWHGSYPYLLIFKRNLTPRQANTGLTSLAKPYFHRFRKGWAL